ncbi:hypothetical protein H0H81_010514 [Sphagnurus paluster]|uniref:Uncharacterized protein n=1 Tax=Sphagnurus paluster TaxID=117069 RepID=A0A9P7GQ21_9AGAR|nr:hypothetical protein H0H81_010514 [Sphagnurus paluster]
MTSFFRDQTFPANWNRRSSAGTFGTIGNQAIQIFLAHPISPGANNEKGVYVRDNTSVDATIFQEYSSTPPEF